MSAPAAPAAQRAEPLLVRTRWRDRDVTLTLGGELDCATAPLLSRRLTSALARQPQRVILDLAALTFTDCAGLGPIIRARHRLPLAIPLILQAPTRAFRALLAITGVDQIPGLHCA